MYLCFDGLKIVYLPGRSPYVYLKYIVRDIIELHVFSHPYWKIRFLNQYSFRNQYQNNIRTIKKYTRTSVKYTSSCIILILASETFPKGTKWSRLQV